MLPLMAFHMRGEGFANRPITLALRGAAEAAPDKQHFVFLTEAEAMSLRAQLKEAILSVRANRPAAASTSHDGGAPDPLPAASAPLDPPAGDLFARRRLADG